jgi:hypothetical protein
MIVVYLETHKSVSNDSPLLWPTKHNEETVQRNLKINRERKPKNTWQKRETNRTDHEQEEHQGHCADENQRHPNGKKEAAVEGRTSTNGTNCMDEINYGAINPNGKNKVSNSLWSFRQYFHIHST